MVSLDDAAKNDKFASSLDADFAILSDKDKSTAKAYGVLGLAGLFTKRWTFYIDREGILRAIDDGVRVTTAGEDMTNRLTELGFPRRS
jgi:peroxiredoxin Q/BCP